MFRTVIVPLDGSPLSETALAPARAVATRLDAPVRLVTSTWGGASGESEDYLAGIAEGMDLPGISGVVVADRFAAGAVTDAARAEADALVVMASHGRSGVGRALLGSTAEAVIGALGGPVMVVGPNAGDLSGWQLGEMVVTVDGSDIAAAAIPVAVQVAAAFSASVRGADGGGR